MNSPSAVVGYQRLRTKHMLPEPIPIATGQGAAPEEEEEQLALPIAERLPGLKPIDTVLRSALGFGIDAVLGLLEIATQPALPAAVNTAQNQYRQEQNRNAETECTAALSVSGLVVRSSVKPE